MPDNLSDLRAVIARRSAHLQLLIDEAALHPDNLVASVGAEIMKAQKTAFDTVLLDIDTMAAAAISPVAQPVAA